MPARLLFAENLAPRLTRDLGDLFPGSTHVRDLNLESAGDEIVWARARDGGLVIEDPG